MPRARLSSPKTWPPMRPRPRKQAAFEAHKSPIKKAEMMSMALNTIGGGLGLVLFGTISNLMGRKGAFVFYHVLGFVCMILMFKVFIPNGASAGTLMVFLPIFGFFTLGMHAGYAVYFPELYPTRLRGTGTGFGFNMGRLGTAAAFFGFGALANPPSPGEQSAAPRAPLPGRPHPDFLCQGNEGRRVARVI